MSAGPGKLRQRRENMKLTIQTLSISLLVALTCAAQQDHKIRNSVEESEIRDLLTATRLSMVSSVEFDRAEYFPREEIKATVTFKCVADHTVTVVDPAMMSLRIDNGNVNPDAAYYSWGYWPVRTRMFEAGQSVRMQFNIPDPADKRQVALYVPEDAGSHRYFVVAPGYKAIAQYSVAYPTIEDWVQVQQRRVITIKEKDALGKPTGRDLRYPAFTSALILSYKGMFYICVTRPITVGFKPSADIRGSLLNAELSRNFGGLIRVHSSEVPIQGLSLQLDDSDEQTVSFESRGKKTIRADREGNTLKVGNEVNK